MATYVIIASTTIVFSTLKKNLNFSIAKITENKSSPDHHGKLKLKRANSSVCKSNGVHLEYLSKKLKPLLEFVASSTFKLGRIFYV
ncbi:hypothetical protein AMTRI_Chr10g232100 [Amborella trichopoda]